MTDIEQVERAGVGVRLTEERLIAEGRAPDALLLRKTFEIIVPALMDSSFLSPPWHPTTMLPIAHRVAHSEGLTEVETLALLLALLCHDAYLGVADRMLLSLPPVEGLVGKVRVRDVRAAEGEKQSQLVDRGVRERTLHCEVAAGRLPPVLLEAGTQCCVEVQPALLGMVCALIERHDLPSTAELKLAGGWEIGVGDLFKPEERDCLLFRSLDRLWMVTPEGVAADEARNLAKGISGVGRAALRRQNADRHFEEYQLYAKVYGDRGIERFGFVERSLYTSALAFQMFRGFVDADD